jgi:hypothetical protein
LTARRPSRVPSAADAKLLEQLIRRVADAFEVLNNCLALGEPPIGSCPCSAEHASEVLGKRFDFAVDRGGNDWSSR